MKRSTHTPPSASRLILRDAAPADVDEMFALRCSVAQNSMGEPELAERGITRASVGAMIESGGYFSPVVEEAGRMVGFGMADLSRGYVFALFVRNSYEGRGIGRMILEGIEAVLRSRGVRQLSLHCGGAPATRAHGFFRHLGWAADGTTDNGKLRYIRELK